MNTPSASPSAPPAPHPVDVRKILRRHRPFFIASSLALGGLIAIEAWGLVQFFPPAGSAPGPFVPAVLAVLFTVAGALASFFLPLALVVPERFPRPVGAFAQAAAYGIVVTLVTLAAVFFLLGWQASFALDAVVFLLKDLYFYALVFIILFHGMAYYVRQMHWLYDEFGGADSPAKPIAASGGIAAMIFIVTLVFLPLDLQTIPNAPAAQRGLVGLFTYGRDLYLITLALGAYAWHLRWIADH